MIMPVATTPNIGPVVVGVDTSGSISDEVLGKFLGCVQQLVIQTPPELLHLVYWDTKIAQHEVYKDYSTIIDSTKPAGGGGTDPLVVTKWIEKNNLKPKVLIMLTDGEIWQWPQETPYPIIWCVDGTNTAPYGKTVPI